MKKFFLDHLNIAVFIIFAVVIFTLYGNSLSFDWTFYDDDVLILDKQDYLSFSNIKNILTDTVFGQDGDKFCRPVLNLTFLIEKYLYGTNPFGYHLTNILLHLFCVFSLYLLLILRYDKKKTFILCMFFAVHPVLVQAVSWIPGRNDTLLTLFIILSFYFLAKAINNKQQSRSHTSIPSHLNISSKKSFLFFCLHFFFFILALFTKETAILAPFFYIIFLFFVRHCEEQRDEAILHTQCACYSEHREESVVKSVIPEGRNRESMLNKYRLSSNFPIFQSSNLQILRSKFSPYLYTSIYLYILISAGYLLYRNLVLSYQTQSVSVNIFIDSFIISFPAVTKYIADIFFPLKLTVFNIMASADYVLCLAVFLVFAFLMLKLYEYKYDLKIVLFGFLWFLLFLLPTFILPYNQFYDHRIYLSLAGILISLSEIFKNYNYKISKPVIFILTVIFVLFSFVTFSHSQKFKYRDTFWINALLDCPQSDIANSVVAGILVENRAYDAAEERYLKAISLHENSRHYVNLAVLYIKTGKFDDAEKCLLKAQVLDEYNPEVYYNLALVYKVKGDREKAQRMKDLFIKIFTATNKVSTVPELKI